MSTTKRLPICDECGSDDVKVDSYATWNVDTQRYEHSSEFDSWYCVECEGETHVKWVDAEGFVSPVFEYWCPDCGTSYGEDSDDKGTVCRTCKRGIVERKESK